MGQLLQHEEMKRDQPPAPFTYYPAGERELHIAEYIEWRAGGGYVIEGVVGSIEGTVSSDVQIQPPNVVHL